MTGTATVYWIEISGKKKEVRMPAIRYILFKKKNLSFLRKRMNTRAKPAIQITDLIKYDANASITSFFYSRLAGFCKFVSHLLTIPSWYPQVTHPVLSR